MRQAKIRRSGSPQIARSVTALLAASAAVTPELAPEPCGEQTSAAPAAPAPGFVPDLLSKPMTQTHRVVFSLDPFRVFEFVNGEWREIEVTFLRNRCGKYDYSDANVRPVNFSGCQLPLGGAITLEGGFKRVIENDGVTELHRIEFYRPPFRCRALRFVRGLASFVLQVLLNFIIIQAVFYLFLFCLSKMTRKQREPETDA